MISILDLLNDIIWSPFLLILMLATIAYHTILLKGLHFRHFARGCRLLFTKEEGEGDVSCLKTVMTTIAGTVGIGNLAGVATALTAGGMGALFWVWLIALAGSVLRFSEAVLAVEYREYDHKYEVNGGPMYYIRNGLGAPKLAMVYAFSGILSTLGAGNLLQANTIADVFSETFYTSELVVGLVLAAFVLMILFGGIQWITKTASFLVTIMSSIYLIVGFYLLARYYSYVPTILCDVVSAAFSPRAAISGFVGYGVMQAMRVGVCRGLMITESGLGTSAIISAAAKVKSPVDQGFIAMVAPLISTFFFCTVTAIIICMAKILYPEILLDSLTGARLTALAFEQMIPYGKLFIAMCVLLFGFTTIIGWAYYGEKCLEYFNENDYVIWSYRIFFSMLVAIGACIDLAVAWKIADIANGLMAYPNLIALAFLGPKVARLTFAHFKNAEPALT